MANRRTPRAIPTARTTRPGGAAASPTWQSGTVPRADSLVASRFRVEALLARGDTSTVARAIDVRTGEPVALKVISMLGDGRARQRFLREVEAMSRVRHPGLVEVKAYGALLDGDAYLATELVTGPTLRDLMKARPPLSPREGAHLLRPVAGALDELHDAGLVHRDVSPDNILVDDRGVGRLVDFGAAYATHDTGKRLTERGTLVGSPVYLAPEAAAGLTPTRAWDVYSLAVVLFEITAGALPFRGVGLDVLAAKLRNPAPALSTVRGSLVTIPVELAIARGLDRRPAGRPRTATDLIDAVEAALGAGG